MTTLMELLKVKQDVMQKATKNNLHSGMVVFVSPIDHNIEERHIFADSLIEVMEWSRTMENIYSASVFPAYVIWLNGVVTYKRGYISDYTTIS